MREALSEGRTDRRPRAIVLVSAADRRILPALRFVRRLAETDVRAVHVSVEPEETRRLTEDWMKLGLTWLPLHIHDPDSGDVVTSLRDAVEREAGGSREVIVVLPELQFTHWWDALLHRRGARRIAQRLDRMSGVTTVIVPFTA